jgi:hypothetical protein
VLVALFSTKPSVYVHVCLHCMPWLKQLLVCAHGGPGSVPGQSMKFVLDEVALGQEFLQVF